MIHCAKQFGNNSEKCEKICKNFLSFDELWWTSGMRFRQFLVKKIRFSSDFTDFWRIFCLFLSFKRVWWPSKYDLDNFQSKKNLIFPPTLPIFESFWLFFDSFWPIFFDECSLQAYSPPPKPPIPHGSPKLSLSIRNPKKSVKYRTSDADHHKPIPDS